MLDIEWPFGPDIKPTQVVLLLTTPYVHISEQRRRKKNDIISHLPNRHTSCKRTEPSLQHDLPSRDLS